MRTRSACFIGLTILSFAASGALAAPNPTALFHAPREAVVALYRLPNIPITPEEKHRFFSDDFAGALIKDSARDDEVGIANDSDYRYDAQDTKIGDLRIGELERNGTLRVAFRNFGRPTVVLYDLCLHQPGDWRIKDVVTSSGGSLRKLLALPSIRQTKAC